MIHNDVDDVDIGMRDLNHSLRQALSFTRTTYLEINPSLCVHLIYTKNKQSVPEKDRIAFTRFRV